MQTTRQQKRLDLDAFAGHRQDSSGVQRAEVHFLAKMFRVYDPKRCNFKAFHPVFNAIFLFPSPFFTRHIHLLFLYFFSKRQFQKCVGEACKANAAASVERKLKRISGNIKKLPITLIFLSISEFCAEFFLLQIYCDNYGP